MAMAAAQTRRRSLSAARLSVRRGNEYFGLVFERKDRMRLPGLICVILLAASTGIGRLEAQSTYLAGPSLGFTPDNSGTAIRPIIGIPGASLLADRLHLDTEIRGALISPKQNYAIAARTEDARMVIIDLLGGGPGPVIYAAWYSRPGADLMAISPSGLAAAAYAHDTKTIQVTVNLLTAPEVIREFDATQIPGRATSIAISDDASLALVRFVEEDRAVLWVLNSAGAALPIAVDQPSAAAFFPNSVNAIVADDASGSAYLFLDVANAAIRIPLTSPEDGTRSFAGAAVSDDGRHAFLSETTSGNVTIVDMETYQSTILSCQCQSTGLYRLKGSSVFRLNETSSEPMMVLDASTSEPRIVLVPPRASEVAEAQQ
jgi:hypothetical protein